MSLDSKQLRLSWKSHIIPYLGSKIIEKKYGNDYLCGSVHKRMSSKPSEQCIPELEKENTESKHANEILQEALVFFAQR